jgi:hypothetical protein
MNILLLNKEDEVVSIYTPNNLNLKKDDRVSVSNKRYKVVNIEKYRKLDVNENVEHVALELKRIDNDNKNDLEDNEIISFVQY